MYVVHQVPFGIVKGGFIRALPHTTEASDALAIVPVHLIFRVAVEEVILLWGPQPQIVAHSRFLIILDRQIGFLQNFILKKAGKF
jgi:hypothetical protein